MSGAVNHSCICMDEECTTCLLTRLQELNGEVHGSHMPLEMFSKFFKREEYKLETDSKTEVIERNEDISRDEGN